MDAFTEKRKEREDMHLHKKQSSWKNQMTLEEFIRLLKGGNRVTDQKMIASMVGDFYGVYLGKSMLGIQGPLTKYHNHNDLLLP